MHSIFTNKIIPEITYALFIAMGAIEASWGIGQIYGLFDSNHIWYAQTGSFYNPGPYAGFLAICLPVCLHTWLRPSTKKNSILQRIGLFTTILILCILPSTMSRAAWVAACISSTYIITKCNTFLTKEFRNRINQYAKLSSIFLVIILTCIFIFFYFIKKDSANGRFLIWKIATQAIIEEPLTGYGWDYVAGAYGDAQEKYFSAEKFTETETYVAGAPEYVFNEYLQVAMAWGIPALLFILLINFFCFYILNKEKEYGLSGAMISLSLFCCASYPFQFIEFVIALLLLLTTGLFSCIKHYGKRWKLLPIITACCLCLVCLKIIQIKHERNKLNKDWERHQAYYQKGNYKETIIRYANHYENMMWNGIFLFEYGYALHKEGLYEKSNKILKEAIKVSSEPMILNIIGKNYQALSNNKEAEIFYLRSCNRIPNRIYPYYLLFKLYTDTKDFTEDKARWAAQTILNKKPKVESTATMQMKEEAQNYIEQLSIL